MPAKERTQNPNVGDQLTLRLFVYNGNARKNVAAVDKVEIYFLDPTAVTTTNTDGRTLVETIDGTSATLVELGQYSITFTATDPEYTIGSFLDIWTVEVETGQPKSTLEQKFRLIPDLWYTSPDPIVYDFSFGFRPNKLRNGSIRWLTIDVRPNVPTLPDLERYYTNLLIASPLKISIEMACVECMPAEEDLRLIVDKADVSFRKGCEGFYLLNTETLEMDCGIYNVWFEMALGESKYISEKQQLQIFT